MITIYIYIYNKKEKVSVHRLYYTEFVGNSEELDYCWKFFPLLKDFVPKKIYFNRHILTDEVEKRELMSKYMNGDFSIIPKSFNKIVENHLNKLNIEFYANKEGEFLVSEEVIKIIFNELWFTQYEIKKYYGLAPYMNKEYLEKNKIYKKMKQNNKKTDECIEAIIQEINSELKQEAKILILSSIEISEKIENKDLKNLILKTTNDYLYMNNINKRLSDFEKLKTKINEEMEKLDENVEWVLEVWGIDEDRLIQINDEYKELSNENKSLKSQNEKLQNKIQELESQKQVISENTESISNINPDIERDSKIIELKREIQNINEENKNLKNDKLELQNRINQLEQSLKEKNQQEDEYKLYIPCKCKELFPNEITDYLYECLYTKLEDEKNKLPANKDNYRKKDVLVDLIESKEFNWEETQTCQKIKRIEKIRSISEDKVTEILESEGIKVVSENEHKKFCFYEKKYSLSHSKTPSDSNASRSLFREIKRYLFLDVTEVKRQLEQNNSAK